MTLKFSITASSATKCILCKKGTHSGIGASECLKCVLSGNLNEIKTEMIETHKFNELQWKKCAGMVLFTFIKTMIR